MKATLLNFLGKPKFDDAAHFVQSLGAGDGQAIEILFQKIIRPVENMARRAGLPKQLFEEILNDVAVIFIQKIREGKYLLTEAPPHAYALGVARWVVQNYADKERNRRVSPSEIEIVAQFQADQTSEQYFSQKENADFLRPLLEKLSEKCRQLIQLRYFDGYSDEETVALGLAPFSTVNSLKNRRKECLTKLRELASRFDKF